MKKPPDPDAEQSDRPILEPPEGHKKVLFHSCCAPCSCAVIEAMTAAGIDFTVYYYNPNIHPREEYELRKSENIRSAQKTGIPFVEAEYDPEKWFSRTEGLAYEPERGVRCSVCFDMRFECAARYAHEHGFPVFTTCQGIARWKDLDQVNASGARAAAKYPGLIYWTYNWRKGGGTNRMTEISKRERFYQQEYCGCVHSLRDANIRRLAEGREKIVTGKKFYGDPIPTVP